MAPVDRFTETIEHTLRKLAAGDVKPDGARTIKAFDRDRGQFLLIDEGWHGSRRVHHVWAHLEVRDGRIWIHEDGTEEGIANLLVAAGISRDRIVLAFYAPALRSATEFAAA